MTGERRVRLALGVIVALAAAIRLSTLGVQSFWLDEATTGFIVGQRSLGEVNDLVWDNETSPPLYYWVAWAWGNVFGTGDVSLRLIPALAGVATIPVAFGIGRRAAGTRAGLVAAALTATSPLLLYYSQENRPYALLILFGALSVLFLQRSLADPSARNLAGWAAAAALGMASHYFAVFLAVPEAAILLLRLGSVRRTLAPIGAVAAAGAALLPLVLHQAGEDRTGFISGEGLGGRVSDAAEYFAKGTLAATPGPGLGIAATVLIAVGAALLVFRTDGDERRGLALPAGLAALGIGIPLVLALAGGSLDVFLYRNVVGAWVPVGVALAGGFAARRAGRAGLAAGVALCAVWAALGVAQVADDDLRRDDWERVAHALGEPREARALLIVPGFADGPLRRYGVDPIPTAGFPTRELIVVGLYPESDVGPNLLGATGFTLVDSRTVQRLTIARYAARRPTPVSAQAFGLSGAKGTPGLFAELP
jgi:mannosyltransferase